MSEASTEIPLDRKRALSMEAGSHVAIVFEDSAEKQSKLFGLSKQVLDSRNNFLLYIAGKQGVKGIRLSMKDLGIDLSFYERNKQLKIVDSEEWFLTSGRNTQFKPISSLEEELKTRQKDALASGFGGLTIIAETDMLVRKGFLPSYKEFDAFLAQNIGNIRATFVCAFDRRELEAAGVRDVSAEVRARHSSVI